MSFRVKQHVKMQPYGKIYLPKLRHLENGSVEMYLADQSESDLPSSETTNLKNVLDAGIDLKQVDSKILGIRNVTVYTDPKSDKSDNNNNETSEEK